MSQPPARELDSAGRLSICTETGTPPAAYSDTNGNLSGYLPALGDAVAARMGLPATRVDSVFDTIIIVANTGKCDIVIADQFITAERQKQIDMIPYGREGEQFLAKSGSQSKFGDPSADPLGAVRPQDWGTARWCRTPMQAAARLVDDLGTELEDMERVEHGDASGSSSRIALA